MGKKLYVGTKQAGGIDGKLYFECPGCGILHAFQIDKSKEPFWGYNGRIQKPTFTPSLLVRWDEGEDRKKKRCHSFVREGRIEFLSDCTHDLAGKTVDMKDID